MWQRVIIVLSAVMCVSQLPGWAGPPKSTEEGKKEDSPVRNVVLQRNEVSGFAVRREMPRQWWKGRDSSGRPMEATGVVQEGDLAGTKVQIHYCEFADTGEAHKAAEFHARNMAAVFQRGLWSGAEHKVIGDETWFSRDGANLALLVRSGRTCVLVSCVGGDAEKQKRIAGTLGGRIVDKISSGSRVMVPGTSAKK